MNSQHVVHRDSPINHPPIWPSLTLVGKKEGCGGWRKEVLERGGCTTGCERGHQTLESNGRALAIDLSVIWWGSSNIQLGSEDGD